MRNLLIALFCLSLIACSKTEIIAPAGEQAQGEINVLSKLTSSSWLHSFEEDNTGRRIYRPASYDFETSHVREGFVFSDKGRMYKKVVNPDDSYAEVQGTWALDGIFVEVTLRDGARFSFTTDCLYKDKLAQLPN